MFQKKATPRLTRKGYRAGHQVHQSYAYRCHPSLWRVNEFRSECEREHFPHSRDGEHCHQPRHWDLFYKTENNPRSSGCPYQTKPLSKVERISVPTLPHSNRDEHTLSPLVFLEKSGMPYKSHKIKLFPLHEFKATNLLKPYTIFWIFGIFCILQKTGTIPAREK